VDAVYDENADFSKYNTFDWALDQEAVKGDFPQFDNQLNREKIQNAIDKEMKAIGFVESTESPSILVDFHISIDEKVAYIDHGNYDFEYWEDYNPDIRPHVYKDGALITHLVDAKTEQLIWEGIGDKTLRDVPPKNIEERIAKAIKAILDKYPIKK
jgi:hypothetical protein